MTQMKCTHCGHKAHGRAIKEGKSIWLCGPCRERQKGLFSGHGYTWVPLHTGKRITPEDIERNYRGKLPDTDVDELKRYAQFRIDRAAKRQRSKPTVEDTHAR